MPGGDRRRVFRCTCKSKFGRFVARWGPILGDGPMSSFDQGGAAEVEPSGSVSVWQHDPGGLDAATPRALGGFAKRGVDFVAALSVLLLLSPLFLFTAGAVRLSGPGPVLYGHERVGLGGRKFRCLKFRTMHADADRLLQDHLARSPEARDEWRAHRKLRNDPRVTSLGRVLREYSVDELPQLLNVLWGDMSLVGPRPVVEAELARYGAAATHYLTARPGITGLWQVSGRSDTGYARRVELDVRYVTTWSVAADLSILLRTLPVVIGARGSY